MVDMAGQAPSGLSSFAHGLQQFAQSGETQSLGASSVELAEANLERPQPAVEMEQDKSHTGLAASLHAMQLMLPPAAMTRASMPASPHLPTAVDVSVAGSPPMATSLETLPIAGNTRTPCSASDEPGLQTSAQAVIAPPVRSTPVLPPGKYVPEIDADSRQVDARSGPAESAEPLLRLPDTLEHLRPEPLVSAEKSIRPEKKETPDQPEGLKEPAYRAIESIKFEGHISQAKTPVADQVKDAILTRTETLQKAGHTDIHLKLDPPELGPIRIHLSVGDDQVNARVVVQEEAARAALENHSAALRDRLSEAGIMLGRFDVTRDGMGWHGYQHKAERQGTVPWNPTTIVKPWTPSQLAHLSRSSRESSIDVLV
jgi:flagellar hook-length control protein FliK